MPHASARVQGRLYAQYGAMQYLRELHLAGNQLTGSLNQFLNAVPENSVLSVLDVSGNSLSGGLFAPDVVKLAAFSSSRFDDAFDKTKLHVFNVENNQLQGAIDDQIIEVRYALLLPRCYLVICSKTAACVRMSMCACHACLK